MNILIAGCCSFYGPFPPLLLMKSYAILIPIIHVRILVLYLTPSHYDCQLLFSFLSDIHARLTIHIGAACATLFGIAANPTFTRSFSGSHKISCLTPRTYIALRLGIGQLCIIRLPIKCGVRSSHTVIVARHSVITDTCRIPTFWLKSQMMLSYTF